MTASVSESLAQIADTHGDIGALCFEKFYQASEEARQLMSHMDDIHRSKMMNEIYRLLMLEDLAEDETYIAWEARTHQHVFFVPDVAMFEVLMLAVRDAAREVLADDWNGELESAWTKQCTDIAGEFARYYNSALQP